MVSPFLFNTEQYYLYSCNMISRAEVRNITDRLQGVKIPLLRMASWGFFFFFLTQVFLKSFQVYSVIKFCLMSGLQSKPWKVF